LIGACYDRGRMELRQLRYFLAVAEELHFTRAAAFLHVAQPAVSHQIRQLEEEIGAKLLERTNRRVRLTPAGNIFRDRARVALEQAARAASDAGMVGRGDAGSVSVGVGSSAVWTILPGLLRRFQRIAPAAAIDIREMEPSEQMEALRHGTLDFGLLRAAVKDPELDSIVISSEKIIVALPERHRAASQRRVDLRTLAKETIVLPRRQSMPASNEIALLACERAGFTPAKMITTRFMQTALCLVAGRLGFALVPELFGHNLRVRGVVYRPLAGTAPRTELTAAWRKDNSLPLAHRFQNELRSLAASHGKSRG
jgi:DNA-binding transcriptional LysR family regulator